MNWRRAQKPPITHDLGTAAAARSIIIIESPILNPDQLIDTTQWTATTARRGLFRPMTRSGSDLLHIRSSLAMRNREKTKITNNAKQ